MEKLKELKELSFLNEKLDGKKYKFNKVRFLTILGFINSRFNHDTLKFEKSARLRLNAYLMALVKAGFCARFSVSNLFEREDTRQLWIGNACQLNRSLFPFQMLV